MVRNGKQVTEDIVNLLRARNSLLWVVTREELRVERAITQASAACKYRTFFWDCATGLTDSAGTIVDANLLDPVNMLKRIGDRPERAVFVLRDLHKWLDPVVLRLLRTLARSLAGAEPKVARAIVILTPDGDVPPELSSATVIDYPLPDRSEMTEILDTAIARLDGAPNTASAPSGAPVSSTDRDAAIDAVIGLTAEEAANCYAKSLITTRRIDPALVSAEKRRVIARERVLTWYDPDPRGFEGLGGLDVLKSWAVQRKASFSAEARAYGLPSPRGAFVVGVQGCGKSLFPKTLASAWGQVLLRLDLGALKSKYVGESEQNIRRALTLAEAVAPCILWCDEIEKALAGSQGPQGDGGVSSDALGTVLTWLQDRAASVFFVATANDVSAIPPEMMRKGRIDETFFVDLPTESERREILRIALKQYGRDPSTIDVGAIARAAIGFTGSEVAQLVPDAMRLSFADGARALATMDLEAELIKVVPLSKTHAEKIDRLREWAKTRARYASTPDVVSVDANGAGAFDLN